MKWVYITENTVREVIPNYAYPPAKWYGAEFASHCIEAPDEVEQGWYYDGKNFLPEKPIAPQTRIDELKALLTSTDYQAIKYAEGLISEEDYAPIKAQRQEWRDEINRLQELEEGVE